MAMGKEIEALCSGLHGRIALIGVGNELRGDDAVGCYIAQQLSGIRDALVIDAGESPENCAHQLRKHEPKLVFLIDAVDMGMEAGSVIILSASELPEWIAVSTHGMPLKLFADYLSCEIKAKVVLIGIQVKSTGLFAPMSEEVRATADALVKIIRSALGREGNGTE